MFENKKRFHLPKSHLINFRKMKDSWDQIEEEITIQIVEERTPIKAWASRDACLEVLGRLSETGKQAPGVTDRVIIWGSAAGHQSADYLPCSSPMPLSLPGNEQPMLGRHSE